jgi:SAM-dependent methyltransferase
MGTTDDLGASLASRKDRSEVADIETSSDAYAARFSGAVGAWMLSVQERLTLELLADLPAATLLDVGGGHGQLARPLGRAGYRVTVLGSDDSCQGRIGDLVASGACSFLTGDITALPFPDGAFDATLSFRLLTHCTAWPALVGELCRVARRRVVVDYPTSQSLNAVAPAWFGAKKKLEGNTRAWTSFRHGDIEAAFARHGFEPLRRAPQFFLPMVLHRALKCRPLSAAMESTCAALGLTRRWGSPVIVALKRVSAGGTG